jgi:hypothetical protein
MHWFWRYVYWPLVRVWFRRISYPNTQAHLAFVKPLTQARNEAYYSKQEAESWRQKYIKASKELTAIKRKGS